MPPPLRRPMTLFRQQDATRPARISTIKGSSCPVTASPPAPSLERRPPPIADTVAATERIGFEPVVAIVDVAGNLKAFERQRSQFLSCRQHCH